MKTPEKRPLMSTLLEDWPLYALLLVVAVITAAVYTELPEELPIHWNWRGEPDNWAPRWLAVILLPATAVGTHLLTVVGIALDPRSSDEASPAKQATLKLFRIAGPIFLACLHVVLLAIWLGKPVDLVAVVLAGCGVLFAVLGNVMGRLEPNYIVGIRLPWTLESERVWKKTHRFAGRLWFLGGCAIVFAPMLPPLGRVIYFATILAIMVIAPAVYAYRAYLGVDCK
jgi:uncharacterized membrane protein